MKIIHVVLGKANPNRMNGVNKVAHSLATTQKLLGHDVTIFGLTNTPEIDKINRSYKLSLYKRNKFYLDANLKKDILKLTPEDAIFHIHGAFIIDFYLISIFLDKNKFRYIFTSHGAYNKVALKKNWLIKSIFFSIFDGCILRNAWKVQFLGQSEYDYIDTKIKNINKILVPNGQNLEDLKFDYKKIISDKKPIFGFVGRIDKHHKGLDKLFNGFLAYKRSGGKGVLWIIGDGPDRNHLENFIIENDLEGDIIFFGSKFNNEKLNLISNMDIFIHTSRFEGFPMAVLEAAGLRKPLLISKETNFSKYVEKYHAGLVLNVNNSMEIAETLNKFEKIYHTNKLQVLSINAYEMIENHFTWNGIVKELLAE
jgi:glycosyltransferase involved in cell wall biosynthesis